MTYSTGVFDALVPLVLYGSLGALAIVAGEQKRRDYAEWVRASACTRLAFLQEMSWSMIHVDSSALQFLFGLVVVFVLEIAFEFWVYGTTQDDVYNANCQGREQSTVLRFRSRLALLGRACLAPASSLVLTFTTAGMDRTDCAQIFLIVLFLTVSVVTCCCGCCIATAYSYVQALKGARLSPVLSCVSHLNLYSNPLTLRPSSLSPFFLLSSPLSALPGASAVQASQSLEAGQTPVPLEEVPEATVKQL